MQKRLVWMAVFTTCALALGGAAAAADPKKLAPIAADDAVSTHGPFEMGACETCHARRDPRNPGPASVSNDTCFGCHDDFKGSAPVKMDKAVHPSVKSATCVACHAPHNSRKRKLLL